MLGITDPTIRIMAEMQRTAEMIAAQAHAQVSAAHARQQAESNVREDERPDSTLPYVPPVPKEQEKGIPKALIIGGAVVAVILISR